VNKATLESLIHCGAFDSTLGPRGISRARADAAVDLALERSRSASKDRERGQTTLFALLEGRSGSARCRTSSAIIRRVIPGICARR